MFDGKISFDVWQVQMKVVLTTLILVWLGKPVDYSNLRIFGCPDYAHVNNGKLVPRAQKCTFVGYGSGVKGYRLLYVDSKRVIVSRDVTFG